MRSFWRRLLLENLGLKLISLAAAVVLWSLLATEPASETSISVAVEFHNFPRHLELVSEQHPIVHLLVQGVSSRIRTLVPASVAVVLDLARVQEPGERTFTLDSSRIVLPWGVTLVRAMPSQLVLKFEKRLTRSVQVLPRFSGVYPEGYDVSRHEVHPPSLKVVGPESRVGLLDYVSTEPIDLSRVIGSASFTVHAYLPDPYVRFENLESVRVNVEMKKR